MILDIHHGAGLGQLLLQSLLFALQAHDLLDQRSRRTAIDNVGLPAFRGSSGSGGCRPWAGQPTDPGVRISTQRFEGETANYVGPPRARLNSK